MKEGFKYIPGAGHRYAINEYGVVLSLLWGKEKVLKHGITEKGYHQVRLHVKYRELKPLSVHRLVAEVFISNAHKNLQINHKDGNKDNNHFSNLEWCTPLENTQHAHNIGLAGSLNKEQLQEVIKLKGIPSKKVAEMYGVHYQTIRRIWRGNTRGPKIANEKGGQ